MLIVRYRTHGPWQQDVFDNNDALHDMAAAIARYEELSKSYTHVKLELFQVLKEVPNVAQG